MLTVIPALKVLAVAWSLGELTAAYVVTPIARSAPAKAAHDPTPAYVPRCSKDVSQVTQVNFEGLAGASLFDDFCKTWSKDKEQTSIKNTNGGQVTLQYVPGKSGGQCTMSCSDTYTSMSIACAQGSGNRKMYTSGSGDLKCGTFSFDIKPPPTKPPPPATTFYFGSVSGDTQSGNSGAGPSQSDVCNYVAYKSGSDICKAGNVVPKDNSGGCPGQKLNSPNFCGQPIGLGYPAGYKLKDNDDCGATENAQYKKDPKKAVPKGTHYADIIDTNNNSKKVGECVYDLSKTGYCTDVITTLDTEHFITCTVH